MLVSEVGNVSPSVKIRSRAKFALPVVTKRHDYSIDQVIYLSGGVYALAASVQAYALSQYLHQKCSLGVQLPAYLQALEVPPYPASQSASYAASADVSTGKWFKRNLNDKFMRQLI